MTRRQALGTAAQRLGVDAEARAEAALTADGWTILARRLRFGHGAGAGEIDLVAEREGLLAFIEVKARPSLTNAAHSVSERQKGRMMAGAEAALAANPAWGRAGVRFDVMLVDAGGLVRRVADAFRME